MFGYSAGVSDIRVTLSDGSYFDCLQKIHPVHRDIVAGLAGNVCLGFLLVDDLKEFLLLEDENSGWIPEFVAEEWPVRAKQLFALFKEENQSLSDHDIATSIQILINNPTISNGMSGQAKSYVLTFDSPLFNPSITIGGKWASIGSGTVDYKNLLSELNDEFFHPLMQLEVNNPGGFGRSLASTIYFQIKESPSPYISHVLQTCLVWPKKTELYSHDMEHAGGGWSISRLAEPDVTLCKSWSDLLSFISDNRLPESMALTARC